MSMLESGRMLSLHVHTAVARQNATDMNPPNGHGGMLTACSIRVMFTADVRESNVTTAVFSKSQRLLSDRTAVKH